MIETAVLEDFNIFFYHGDQPLKDTVLKEIESDILAGAIQPRKSMFYNRQDGCGISERENYPNAISLQIMLRFDIASYFSYRNTQVDDGSLAGIDRRASVSQNSISFDQDKKGNLSIRIFYIPFLDYSSKREVSVPTGG